VRLTGSVHIGKDTDLLYDDLALAMFGVAQAAVKQRGVFHVALSGGSTPEPFYIRLVTDPRFRGLPWQDTHIWVVDERRVPETDDKSNTKMLRETLIDHVPIRKRQVHPMPVMESDPAGLYEKELARVFDVKAEAPHGHAGLLRGAPALDFVLLGMGDDTHTASLFPGSPALSEQRRWVAANDGPKVTPPPRVTLTFPILNAARHVAVLVTGAKKQMALRLVEKQASLGEPDVQRFPITGVNPTNGELTWYLDPAAAGTA
jgi:6-phosphogluconolactonase